jgi:glycosyltransferase involved in cell wall biosynthesis
MIDPRAPNYLSTPASPDRPRFAYAPRAGTESLPPIVSVITPFFNSHAHFEETARCILGQSLQRFEWIIINDGSTDPDSLAALERYRPPASPDSRIRIIDHDCNRGLSAARNTGFKAARADYVFQLDADDLIEPTTLETCAAFLATHPEYAFVKGWSVGFGAETYLWTRGFHEGPAFLEENIATATAMVRRSVHAAVGGYDEEIKGGLEDWEFWLRCGAAGHWGATIPEYLDWYRRREGQWEAWENGVNVEKRRQFRETLRARYPALFEGRFPQVPTRWPVAYEAVPGAAPFSNPLAKPGRRLMLIVPWLTLGGADKFNRNVAAQLAARGGGGWEITIATTLDGDHSWLPEFTRITPDVLAMPHFLRTADTPAYLRGLIESRRPDVVMISNSELAYLCLPYLRAHCPEPLYVDYCHMEEEYWKNGGYPRYAAASQAQLDLHIVSSEHLKGWISRRGAEPERIEVCRTCEDTELWRPDAEARARIRSELEIPEDRTVILYAGRIVQQKQPRVFANTMRLLAAEVGGGERSFTALVAGDGPDLPWLRRFVEDYSLSGCVRFLGPVRTDEMPGTFAASDIFFLPSLWEGIALTIFEAMSAGLAVVGADVGGQRELVLEDCGVLIPRSDEATEAAAYARELARLIADPGARAGMGRSARARITDHFKLSDLASRLEELFALAARWRARRPRRALEPALADELATRAVEYIRAFWLTETLWSERESLRASVSAFSARLNGAPPPDPTMLARQIIEENVRYRIADRVNNLLKSLGLQRRVKRLAIRTLDRRHD